MNKVKDHTYRSISQIQELYFSHCNGCMNSCCDGSRFSFSPLILNDFEEVYEHFPILFGKITEEWRILIAIAQNGSCRYYQEHQCTIYDKRPPGCRIYPLTPYYEDILVDTACHAVNICNGVFLANINQVNSDFYHERLENFENKRRKTVEYIQELNGEFELLGVINGLEIYAYSGEREDQYITMHRESLRWLS